MVVTRILEEDNEEEKNLLKKITELSSVIFTNSAPLDPVGHRVAMSVCLSAPSGAVFFEASHWP